MMDEVKEAAGSSYGSGSLWIISDHIPFNHKDGAAYCTTLRNRPTKLTWQ